jgi:nucleotide-binding universal stress UspA family protein
MDLYVEESGIELLKKTELILKAILDEKKMDESYKKRIKKKIAIDLQIAVKHLELYTAKCKLIIKDSEEIQVNIDLAESIIKLLEASLGTDNSERFEEYYNTASNLLSDLKDLEEEQEEESEREEIGEEAEEETGDKEWFKEDEIEYEKETDRKNGGAEL